MSGQYAAGGGGQDPPGGGFPFGSGCGGEGGGWGTGGGRGTGGGESGGGGEEAGDESRDESGDESGEEIRQDKSGIVRRKAKYDPVRRKLRHAKYRTAQDDIGAAIRQSLESNIRVVVPKTSSPSYRTLPRQPGELCGPNSYHWGPADENDHNCWTQEAIDALRKTFLNPLKRERAPSRWTPSNSDLIANLIRRNQYIPRLLVDNNERHHTSAPPHGNFMQPPPAPTHNIFREATPLPPQGTFMQSQPAHVVPIPDTFIQPTQILPHNNFPQPPPLPPQNDPRHQGHFMQAPSMPRQPPVDDWHPGSPWELEMDHNGFDRLFALTGGLTSQGQPEYEEVGVHGITRGLVCYQRWRHTRDGRYHYERK
ncbi:hypothetical protein TWF281_002126 [Arthrobotrys megalospora]